MATPRSAASTIVIKGGTAEVKAYPVTEDELATLAVIQGGSSLFFSIAGAALGFWINLSQQLDFSDERTPAHVKGFWSGLHDASFYVCIACFVIGIGLFGWNGFRVRTIKGRTQHI